MKLYKILVVDNYRHTPVHVFEYTVVVAQTETRALELAMEYWKDITLSMTVEKVWDTQAFDKELVLA